MFVKSLRVVYVPAVVPFSAALASVYEELSTDVDCC